MWTASASAEVNLLPWTVAQLVYSVCGQPQLVYSVCGQPQLVYSVHYTPAAAAHRLSIIAANSCDCPVCDLKQDGQFIVGVGGGHAIDSVGQLKRNKQYLEQNTSST